MKFLPFLDQVNFQPQGNDFRKNWTIVLYVQTSFDLAAGVQIELSSSNKSNFNWKALNILYQI